MGTDVTSFWLAVGLIGIAGGLAGHALWGWPGAVAGAVVAGVFADVLWMRRTADDGSADDQDD